MGRVELDAVEPRLLAHRGSGREPVDDLLDLIRGQRSRDGRAGQRQRYSARGDRLVADVHQVGLASRVVELGEDRRTAVVRCLGPFGELGKCPVVLDDDVAGLTEVVAVDHDVAGDEQAVASLGPPAIQRDDPLVGRVVGVSQRLAECRLRNPVGQSHAAGKFERVVE